MLGGILLYVSLLVYVFKQNKKISLEEKQFIYSWLLFLLITSFLPKLLDNYHSQVLWIGIAFIFAWIIQQISHQQIRIMAIISVCLVMVINSQIWKKPTWDQNMPRTKEVGHLIAQDALKNQEQQVNVASLVDADARATRFRYFIISNGQNLLGIDQYDQSQTLYVISQKSIADGMLQNPAWEISSFKNHHFTQLWTDGDWILYKSTKKEPSN